MPRSECFLKYSPIGSIPVVGYVYYCIQLMFLKLGLIQTFYLSHKQKRYLPWFVALLEKQGYQLVCTTWRLGHVLTQFNRPIHLSIQDWPVKWEGNQSTYERLVWSLVVVTTIEPETLHYLNQTLKVSYDQIFGQKL